jgi:phage tail sheath protein FI
VADYRRPGVYIEEQLSTSPFESANATAVACFVGVTSKGTPLTAMRVDSWSDFVQKFGGFDLVPWAVAPVSSPGRSITGNTTSGSANVAGATGMTQGDVGRSVTGTGIAGGTTISSVTNATTFVLSANATATGTGVSLTLGALSTPGSDGAVLSYLPYAVYLFYQNGGRGAYVVRAMPAAVEDQGVVATATITDGEATPADVIDFEATGAGVWGNSISIVIQPQATAANGRNIFTVAINNGANRVETFTNLSMGGVEGTRPLVTAINDPLAGSRYVRVVSADTALDPNDGSYPLTGGLDPELPVASDLISQGVTDAIKTIEGPLLVSFQPFQSDTGSVIMPPAQAISGLSGDRADIFVVWDGNPVSEVPGGTTYTANVKSRAASVGTDNSYAALYCPWVVTPDPARPGATIAVPPSGAVKGVYSRIDVTQGPWRTPAGVPASMSNVLTTELKFTDTDQGDLNYNNINVIRAQIGAGICIMGGRTRKLWGPDRYIGARRTLIFLKETLRRATAFAVFENNDQRLWSALRQTANRILQPVWEQGGLKGNSPNEAYFVRCDETINTPQVIQSGEVRMEIGVALQAPAEFVIIRISQFDSGGSLAIEGINVNAL